MKRGVSEKEKRRFNKSLIHAKRSEASSMHHKSLAMYEKCAAIRRGDSKLDKKIQSLRNKIKDPSVLTLDSRSDYVTDTSISSDDDSEENERDDCSLESDDDGGDGISDRSVSRLKLFSDETLSGGYLKPPSVSSTATTPTSNNYQSNTKSQQGQPATDKKAPTLLIPSGVYSRLHKHQKEGIQWLWNVHNMDPHGGILCDDMGLGKTAQVSTFLLGLFKSEVISKALIVTPTPILDQWRSELGKWAPDVPVTIYHSKYFTKGSSFKNGICLTTYGMVLNHTEELSPRGIVWDYVILDEGHIIKNNRTRTSKCAQRLNSERRLIITGTPIMNNLRELWSLVNWVCQGKLLGNKKIFHSELEDKIIRGTDKEATNFEKVLGNRLSESLRSLIAPHILRREKKDIFVENPSTSAHESTSPAYPVPKKIPKKNDIVIWIKLTSVQTKIYQKYTESNEVDKLMEEGFCSFAALKVLQKICNHPILLKTQKTSAKVDLTPLNGSNDLVETSAKMPVLLSLLNRFASKGHKTLIFSRSTKMLNIIQGVLAETNIKFFRVDGSRSIKKRKSVISMFTQSDEIKCFLLTTQVGAVGLNLVAADRVIICIFLFPFPFIRVI